MRDSHTRSSVFNTARFSLEVPRHTWNLHYAPSMCYLTSFAVYERKQKLHNPVTDGVLDGVIACSPLSRSGRIWKRPVLLIHQPSVHGPAQKQDIRDINKWTHTQGSGEPTHTSAHSGQPLGKTMAIRLGYKGFFSEQFREKPNDIISPHTPNCSPSAKTCLVWNLLFRFINKATRLMWLSNKNKINNTKNK